MARGRQLVKRGAEVVDLHVAQAVDADQRSLAPDQPRQQTLAVRRKRTDAHAEPPLRAVEHVTVACEHRIDDEQQIARVIMRRRRPPGIEPDSQCMMMIVVQSS